MKYPVNEIFETIQGEAKYTGTPAIFIRLQGCPVGCGWCDTKHTWDVADKDKAVIGEILIKTIDSPRHAYMSADEIWTAIKHYKAKHIVITGGEPCLYDLTSLTTHLIHKAYSVQIETSGTHAIECHPEAWVTVSPKINMDGGFKILKSAMVRANEIKHPVGKEKDGFNLMQLLEEMPTNERASIWLQPLSQSEKATSICVKMAIENGWKVSIQTHKYMGVR